MQPSGVGGLLSPTVARTTATIAAMVTRNVIEAILISRELSL